MASTDFDWSGLSDSTPSGATSADWQAVEDEIRRWVAASTGLSTVVWDQQTHVRPAVTTFATLHREFGRAAGAVDENRTRDNPASTGSDGEEILFETFAHIDFVVRVQVFAKGVTGNGSAGALLSRAARFLSLQTQIDTFDTVGIAVVEVGAVQNLSGLVETKFESRAALDVRFRVADGASQTTTFIESVDWTNNITA